MRRASNRGIWCVAFCALFLALRTNQLNAGQSPGIVDVYDDLGRLVRVIVTTANQCATYEYDAVGNILSITHSTNCLQPPTINSFSRSSKVVGDNVCLTIGEPNFFLMRT